MRVSSHKITHPYNNHTKLSKRKQSITLKPLPSLGLTQVNETPMVSAISRGGLEEKFIDSFAIKFYFFLVLANLRLKPVPKATAIPAPRIVKGSGTTITVKLS